MQRNFHLSQSGHWNLLTTQNEPIHRLKAFNPSIKSMIQTRIRILMTNLTRQQIEVEKVLKNQNSIRLSTTLDNTTNQQVLELWTHNLLNQTNLTTNLGRMKNHVQTCLLFKLIQNFIRTWKKSNIKFKSKGWFKFNLLFCFIVWWSFELIHIH